MYQEGGALNDMGERMARAYAPEPQTITCPYCLSAMQGCFRASDGMKLRAWLCVHCGHIDKAIGRERLIVQGVDYGSASNG